MKKGTSIVLLSILSVLMAFVLVITFARFPVGTNKSFNSVLGAIELDYGMSDSAVYTLELDKTSDIPEDITDVLSTIENRLVKLGFTNTSVKAVRDSDSDVYDIRVIVNPDINDNYEPDTDSVTSAVQTAVAYGELHFYGGTSENPTDELFIGYNPIDKVEYSGYSDTSDAYLLNITFTRNAFDEISDIMDDGDFYFLAKLGDDELSPFDGSSAISSSYFNDRTIAIQTSSEITAKQMALQISTGGLAYKYSVSENVALISPIYGNNIAVISLITIGALLLLYIIVMIISNKGLGLVAGLTTLFYALTTVLMLIAVPGVKLSIGGIIGLLTATVFAVDGTVILTKRIKEEYSMGKTVKSAVKFGYKRALMPVLNIGVIGGISALVLLLLCSLEIKAFAVTFGIGIVVALICSLVISRMYLALLLPLAKNKEKFLNLKREDA